MGTSNLFANLKRAVESLGLTVDQTRYAIAFGARETTTGWRAVTHGTSTIEMPILPRSAALAALRAGVYARHNWTGWTLTAVVEGDMVKDADNVYYEVLSVEKVQVGDMLFYYECELSKMPMYQAEPAALTWSLTRPDDPRKRTKVFIDTYIRDAQVTKDDDSTQATWACIFNDPPYHLSHEFRAASTPVQGLYVNGMPESIPWMDVDQVPCRYEENVPIHICTVNSTACTGTALQWKMEAELRYQCEQQPTGSQRALNRRSDLSRDLGGMWLYDTLFTLSYVRDITT